MQKQPKTEQELTPEEHSGGILLWLLLGILITMLIAGSTALATYLGLVTPDDIANMARKASQIPGVVVKYFNPENATNGTESVKEEKPVPQTQPAQGGVPAAPVQSVPEQEPNVQREKPVTVNNKAAAAKSQNPEEARNISRLARLYANMKPDEAAPILQELDDDLIVSILRKMEDEQAAKILAALEAEHAANLTRLYAGQKSAAQNPGSAKPNKADLSNERR